MTVPRRLRILLVLMTMTVFSTPARADTEDPIVRITLSPGTVDLGESARMQITVLVPTWQPVPPLFPSFEIPNAITRLPANSAHPTSEKVGPDTWSGIIRNYQVTPLIAADFRLGGEQIRITWADPGKANRQMDVPVPVASLSVRMPPGAAQLDPYLAGSRFTLERTIDDPGQTLAVGDALVIHYRATLDGMPALFLPPLAPGFSSPLVSAYPEEPEISQSEAGRAVREETLTLLLNRSGRLELPGRTVAWWNTTTEQIEQAHIEAMEIDIAAATIEDRMPEGNPQAGTDLRALLPAELIGLLIALLIALLIVLVVRRWLPRLLMARRRRAAAFKESEAYAFAALKKAASPRSVYTGALCWLKRLNPDLDLRQFAARFGSPALSAEVEALSRGLYRETNEPFEVRTFLRALADARSNYLAAHQAMESHQLAPLNPAPH